ncbi:hypothetical protein BDV25DRAFT_87812 [Aspergillus avenaceus]|uniref:Protein kinase domain-containing protein n=1 Tax=Aspergillus avenaceus TaxID=36643 RepID=A0A5N6TZH3_ASPAV|nr:hypothetical protein BDV25DRAFT_87812 [Aspergillus avenaceus]
MGSVSVPQATNICLSADRWANIAYYRILRLTPNHAPRILYVKHDAMETFIMPKAPSWPSHLERLCSIPDFHKQDWTTMTLDESWIWPWGYTLHVDQFEAHCIPPEFLCSSLPKVNLVEFLPVESMMGDAALPRGRVFRAQYRGVSVVLKVANFAYQVRKMKAECDAYRVLLRNGCTAAPRLLGYVFEEVEARVVGVILEDVTGRRAKWRDLDACLAALGQIHQCKILHNRLNPEDILVTGGGVKFLDFGSSSFEYSPVEGWKQKTASEANLLGYIMARSGSGKKGVAEDDMEMEL